MNKILSFLMSVRLYDEDKTLSLTNVLLFVAITNLAIAPADAYTVAILTLALGHANLKKFSRHKAKLHADAHSQATDASKEQIEKLQKEVSDLTKTINFQKLR